MNGCYIGFDVCDTVMRRRKGFNLKKHKEEFKGKNQQFKRIKEDNLLKLKLMKLFE